MSSLAPVPSENATCPNCSAPLVADQRYCLSCGQPVTPVRLAFLDVLDRERQASAGAASPVPVAYTPYAEPVAGPPWLRRYAPLFGVLSVLLLALIVGLLVGHWVTQSNKTATGPQVIKVEGLSAAAPAATATTPTASTPTTTTSTGKSAASAKGEEEAEKAEAKKEEEEEAKHPAKAPPAKDGTSQVQKLEKTTGKQHEAELNKLSTAPIEVK